MQSIAYPDMFTSSRTLTYTDHDATLSNLILLLKSDKNSLFGDPDFGTNLQKVIFMQNNIVLQDLVIDEIYSCIQIYIPQLYLKRTDIQLYAKDNKLYCKINATNLIDHTNNLYEVPLATQGEY